MKLYVVEMLRWGDREKHSYVVGVFSTREQAELIGDAHKSWRGFKYEYEITEVDIDVFSQEVLDYHKQCIEWMK